MNNPPHNEDPHKHDRFENADRFHRFIGAEWVSPRAYPSLTGFAVLAAICLIVYLIELSFGGLASIFNMGGFEVSGAEISSLFWNGLGLLFSAALALAPVLVVQSVLFFLAPFFQRFNVALPYMYGGLYILFVVLGVIYILIPQLNGTLCESITSMRCQILG